MPTPNPPHLPFPPPSLSPSLRDISEISGIHSLLRVQCKQIRTQSLRLIPHSLQKRGRQQSCFFSIETLQFSWGEERENRKREDNTSVDDYDLLFVLAETTKVRELGDAVTRRELGDTRSARQYRTCAQRCAHRYTLAEAQESTLHCKPCSLSPHSPPPTDQSQSVNNQIQCCSTDEESRVYVVVRMRARVRVIVKLETSVHPSVVALVEFLARDEVVR